MIRTIEGVRYTQTGLLFIPTDLVSDAEFERLLDDSEPLASAARDTRDTLPALPPWEPAPAPAPYFVEEL